MFCKNCGKNLGEVQSELCAECEANLKTNPVTNENVEVIKEVNSNGNNYNNNNYGSGANTNNVNYTNSNPIDSKSKLAAGLLGIFLGSFGVHNFYLGYSGKAVAQLLITILSCGSLALVSSIWGLIEGILILSGEISKDANGVPLKD